MLNFVMLQKTTAVLAVCGILNGCATGALPSVQPPMLPPPPPPLPLSDELAEALSGEWFGEFEEAKDDIFMQLCGTGWVYARIIVDEGGITRGGYQASFLNRDCNSYGSVSVVELDGRMAFLFAPGPEGCAIYFRGYVSEQALTGRYTSDGCPREHVGFVQFNKRVKRDLHDHERQDAGLHGMISAQTLRGN